MNFFLFLGAFLFVSGGMLFAQTQDDLNQVLRDQLGIENKETQKKDKEPFLPQKSEKNPIEERYVNKEESPESNLLWILVKLLTILGILLAAFYYIARYLRKNQSSRFPLKGDIRLISQAYLGAGKEIQVVDVAGMLFVLGVTEHSIQLIKEIHDPIIREKIYTALDSAEPPQENFFEYFLNRLNNKDKSSTSNSDQEEIILEEIQKRQKAKLEELKRKRGKL